jgi:RNA polymerase sigma factor (sigma-70 family)
MVLGCGTAGVDQDAMSLQDTFQRDAPAAATPTEEAQRAYLALLFEKYRSALLRHVSRFTSSREDAADLVHDTYIRVMHRISLSRLDAAARGYLFQTATNLARDHRRRQRFRAHARLDEVPEEGLISPGASPEESFAADQVNSILNACLREMPDDVRSVFVLVRSQGMSYPEVARYLAIGRRTVERRMAEAMSCLAARFGGEQ